MKTIKSLVRNQGPLEEQAAELAEEFAVDYPNAVVFEIRVIEQTDDWTSFGVDYEGIL
ncbi:hypothetical protein SEA_KEELAN_132 [Gordonia phage Keelan]|nr:hypothetical protein SEA_KEELAN_132 [Gordonia phage Keelan]